jgi:DNA-binding response OmpR family regulator
LGGYVKKGIVLKMPPKKILIVEDDRAISELISSALKRDGFGINKVESLQLAREALKRDSYTVVILDINLPDGLGLELIGEIREQAPETLIIVVSARSTGKEVDLGLELGADDYLTKPFRISELRLRIGNLIKRSQLSKKVRLRHYEFKNCLLDYTQKSVSYNSKRINLNSKEFNLLYILLVNQNRVVSREFIYNTIWGANDLPDYHRLEATLSNLRKKLRTAGPDFIKTKAKVGYYLE